MKKYTFLLLYVLTSCGYPITGLRTYELESGYSRVAKNPRVYSNRAKFDRKLLDVIDTQVIYERFDKVSYVGLEPREVQTVSRKNPYSNHHYGAYRFYRNGNFNIFILNKNDSLSKKLLNPGYTGWRGVYYRENSQIKGDLMTQVSDGGAIGKREEIFEFSGDTLVVIQDNESEDLYVKRNIPLEFLDHKADW